MGYVRSGGRPRFLRPLVWGANRAIFGEAVGRNARFAALIQIR